MNMRSDRGFTLPELLVTVSLLFLLLGAVYFALEGIEVSAQVSQRQAAFARDISTPLHAMDKVLCQNKAILPDAILPDEPMQRIVSDGYTLITRSPVQYGTGTYTFHVYTVEYEREKWHLVERTYRRSLTSTTLTGPLRRKVWSDNNANKMQEPPKPVFTYLDSEEETITITETDPYAVARARSVVVVLWAQHDGEGDDFSGRRRIYFRNR